MSNIDKRSLREAAERAGQNDWEYVYTSDLSAPGRGYITVGGAEAIYCLNKATGGVKQSENVLRYIAAANPATVLALLDELEAKDKLNAELMEKQRLIDICQGQGLEYRIAAENRAETAEKRIAELEARTVTVKLPADYRNSDGNINADMFNTCEVVGAFRDALAAAGIGVKGD
ncbi:ead/Ea22-like family protein [Enterobacter roggenkampii]|uniref:ead/Ea22-like family protein n=1 Tax=Enterobacter roggenkampii TaxID=1812935 RepID=UPI0006978047|nr:ead/Ea22-like family protein [Enterobacter roggenkampii]MDL0057225.1 ead/Ea22-like family protein [Enterobacter roggenkampii]